jgi:hypothetical protein
MNDTKEKLEKLTLDGIGESEKKANKSLAERIKTYQKDSQTRLGKPVSRKYEITCVSKEENPKQVEGKYRSENGFTEAVSIAKEKFAGKYEITQFIVACTYMVSKAVIEKQAGGTGTPAGRIYGTNRNSIDRIFKID